ncbi:PDZ domain-containing protein [Trichostrongylus colubriformis]|uniref:PDZ domain-containing protein n=1 Tax=Trichostrongylus colubriformis TaxID=6319 RepID=A0AAN8IPJ1_TRICO
MSNAPELGNTQLGLHVKYDARERLQVHNVDYSSIAAVHLRPGDIIREVDDKPVASKTMLKYYVTESMTKNRRICFLIECPAGEAYRECCDMAPDVTEIALKQIERFKKAVNQTPAVSAYSAAHSKKSVSIAPQEKTEVEIAADFDPTKLRPCKNAK